MGGSSAIQSASVRVSAFFVILITLLAVGNILGDALTGHTSGIHGKAHGIAGQGEVVAVAVNGVGIGTGTVQAFNRHQVLVQYLAVFIDTDTAHSAVSAQIIFTHQILALAGNGVQVLLGLVDLLSTPQRHMALYSSMVS